MSAPNPTGFQLGLVEDWEIVDLAEPAISYIGLSDAAFTLATAHWRLADIERATQCVQLQARLERIVDGSPAEAECALSVYATDVDNDPGHLEAALAKDGDPTDRVALPAGPSVRRTGLRPRTANRPDRFVHQFFIPVPGTWNEIVFLEFWSPTFAAEGFFRTHFEGVASSFEFTYTDSQMVLGDSEGFESEIVVEPATRAAGPRFGPFPDDRVSIPPPQMGGLVRRTFAGWPRRFTPLIHLAVGTWMVAALVVLSRVVTDAGRGVGAVLDDVFGTAFLAFFGLVGYLFDQSQGRERRWVWLAFGLVWLWAAITCPEGRFGYVC